MMAARVIETWQVGERELGEAVYEYTKLWGLKRLMKGHKYARAVYGQFEVDGRYVVHSLYAGDGLTGYSTESEVEAEITDDITHLKDGYAELSN